MDNPDTIQTADSGRKSRRGILAALGLGGAATALVMSARPAQAQTTDTTVASTDAPPADTTATTEPLVVAPAPTDSAPTAEPISETAATTPPKKVQPEDLPLLAAGKVLELTAASAYASVNARIGKLGMDEAATALFAALESHHSAYAQALSAAYGPGSPGEANPALLAKLGGDVYASGDKAAVLDAARNLEQTAADTHQSLLGSLISTDAAALVASIQIVEARHAVTLLLLQGKSYADTAVAVEPGGSALGADVITGGN